MPTSEHTMKQFDAELEAVRARVLQMGGLVEDQATRAIQALASGDLKVAAQVVEDDHRVNALEVAIDEDCNTIIARRQPAAIDLRMLMMMVKTITDLERIGDEAAKIARMAQLLHQSDRPYVPRTGEIRRVSELALGMLRSALDAFARLDLAVAARVVRQDADLDEAFRAILRQLITFMMEDPRTISHAIETLFVGKALERIGDHSKNICEYVVYMVKGKDVRHTGIEGVEREALSAR